MKNLNMFKRYTPTSAKRMMTSEQKEQVLLARLVNSPEWAAVKRATGFCLSRYAAAPPLKLNLLIGYLTFSILRDGFNQLIDHIESEAMKAPNPHDFDE